MTDLNDVNDDDNFVDPDKSLLLDLENEPL